MATTTICGWFEYRTHQNGDDLGDIEFTWVYHICEVCPKFFGGLKHLELPFFRVENLLADQSFSSAFCSV